MREGKPARAMDEIKGNDGVPRGMNGKPNVLTMYEL
jgi:hypothetical protein